EREGELAGTWRMEEVGLRASGEDEVVAFEDRAVGKGRARWFHVGRDGLRPDRRDTLLTSEHLGVIERDVPTGEFGGGDLVEQRLELLVTVLIDQGHLDAVLLGEEARARDAGEAATNDHDVVAVRRLHASNPRAGSSLHIGKPAN